jgi:hypothetical protein
LTADINAPDRCGVICSCPFSWLITARTADASRTTLLTFCLFAALRDEFIDEAHAGRDDPAKILLGIANHLFDGSEAKTITVFFHDNGVAFPEYFSQACVRWNDHSSRAVNLCPENPMFP